MVGILDGDLDHADGLVDAGAVDVFAQQVVAAKPSCGLPSYSPSTWGPLDSKGSPQA
ncbi:MAG TPA: hypothetical protein VMW24_18065 [Sedimentisphaerales bacterium]|nr:hypothetical protein [Sedimentisphaerales bacterium]